MFRILWGQPTTEVSPESKAIHQAIIAEGYTIEGFPLEQIVSHAGVGRVDLIILDASNFNAGNVEGQGLNGHLSLEVCQTLKSNPQTETIPVVFCLAELENPCPDRKRVNRSENKDIPQQLSVVTCFEYGATDVLLSPALQCLAPVGRDAEMYASPENAHWPNRLEEHLARIKAALRIGRGAHQSRAVARQLDEMNNELYERNLQVEKELYIARQLQQSLLPPFLPDPPGTVPTTSGMRFSKCHYRDERIRITGLYLPCDALGGDLYDVIPFADGTIGVSVADVSGHGVPAAFITAIYKSSFYRITHTHTAPDQILHDLNDELADIVKTGDYVTALYARIHKGDDNASLMLDYSGAGHPYPLHYQAKTGELDRLRENATPLVWIKGMVYPIGCVSLEPGDKILLFTDGVSEMKNLDGAMFGEPALEKSFLRLLDQNPAEQPLLDALVAELSDFADGAALDDDVSMVLIEIL